MRLGTIFGTSNGMRFHTAVNKFCWQAVNGAPISVWETAYNQKRPYLDLADAVDAISFVISQKLFDGQVYNVVTGNHTVKDVVNAIKQHLPATEVEFVKAKIMNQLSYEVLNKKLENKNFKVKGNLENGIAQTLNLLSGLNNKLKGGSHD